MKNSFLSISLIGLFTLFFYSSNQKTIVPEIELENTYINLGVIENESDAIREISFKNIGDKPLIIYNIKSDSEHLTTKAPLQKPLQPNETGVITIKYDINKIGRFSIRLRVKTNIKGTTIVYISGYVVNKNPRQEPIDTLKLAPQTNPINSQIRSKSIIIDYGIVEQNSDPKRELFFKNIGDEPLIVRSLKSSCGCLVGSFFPRGILFSNKKGMITARYDTKRIGKINKTLTLRTNAGTSIIRVKGEVIKKQTTEQEEAPINILELKPQETKFGREIYLKSKSIDYGVVKYGGNPVRKIPFKNIGDKPLVIKDVRASCGCLIVSYNPTTPLQPNETGMITVRYDTKRARSINKSITLVTNAGRLMIRVKGWVMPKNATQVQIDSAQLIAQQIKTGPKIQFEDRNVNYGIISPDSIILRVLKFKNIGHQPLKITTIEKNDKDNPYLIRIDKKTILPNETGEIIIQYNPKDLGKFSHYLSIKTNERYSTIFNKYLYRTYSINIRGFIREE